MREYAATSNRSAREQEDYLVSIGMPAEMRRAVGQPHSNDPPRLKSARQKDKIALGDDRPRLKIARQYQRIATGQ